MRRGSGKIITIAAVAMLTLGADAAWADASIQHATPGWRVVKVYAQCDNSAVAGTSATGARDAWVTGSFDTECPGKTDALIARWDGRSWQELQPPSQFVLANGTAVAALSRSYAWTFLDEPYPGGSAVLWQNGRWHAFKMPGDSPTTSAAVFSRSDAWAFNGTFATRFNGRGWHRVLLPVDALGTAAAGPRSIWAVGPPTPSGTSGQPPYALAHWTGRWRTLVIPYLNLPPTEAIYGVWVVPDKSAGAWVLAEVAGRVTGLLMHWTGSTWRLIKIPYLSSGGLDGVGPLARDGSGGVWIATSPQQPMCQCPELAMVHYTSAGTWTRQFVPVNDANITSMRLVPGTRSIWAGGAAGGGFATILKYGP